MLELIRELLPICRSISGDGVRETLRILKRRVPLEIHEVPSGTQVLDWTVPPEWNIRDAYIKGPDGAKVVDFSEHNLHLVGYSIPTRQTMPLAELDEHLHSLPEQPELVPYRTSYYNEVWGFCLSHERRTRLAEGEYEVVIDSSLEPGHLTYGELVLPGERQEEILVSCHVCHPSLANDNLSGLAVAVFLARALAQDAHVYFMDEPFAGVDVATERAIVDVLREWRQAGKTVIAVHHDLQTVPDYFDHVVLLNVRVVASGPVDRVFTHANLQRTYGGRLTIFEETAEAIRRSGQPGKR